MSDYAQVVMPDETAKPSIKPYMVECKFTVERREGWGGDWQRNQGGATNEQRVTYEGFATDEMCAALVESIKSIAAGDGKEQ